MLSPEPLAEPHSQPHAQPEHTQPHLQPHTHPQPQPAPPGSRAKTYLLLHGILLLYSLAALCSKTASAYAFASWGFIGWYGGALILLAVYAFFWQKALKRLPLISAYANKGVTILWGFLWGMLLFSESIGLTTLIGGALVFTGILLVVTSGE